MPTKEETMQLVSIHPLLTDDEKKEFQVKIDSMTDEERHGLHVVLETNLSFVEESKKVYEWKMKSWFRNLGDLLVKKISNDSGVKLPFQAKQVIMNFMQEEGNNFIKEHIPELQKNIQKIN